MGATTRLCALLLTASMGAAAVARYATVVVSPDGKVEVVTEDGRRSTIPNDLEQVGAQQAAVAPDHQSVGWLAIYDRIDPYPLRLVILYDGQLRRLRGEFGEPIWFWIFQDGGKHVAFKEETPHGSMGLHYELWDVTAGERVADYKPTYDGNGRVIARPNEPKWVQALEVAQTKAK